MAAVTQVTGKDLYSLHGKLDPADIEDYPKRELLSKCSFLTLVSMQIPTLLKNWRHTQSEVDDLKRKRDFIKDVEITDPTQVDPKTGFPRIVHIKTRGSTVEVDSSKDQQMTLTLQKAHQYFTQTHNFSDNTLHFPSIIAFCFDGQYVFGVTYEGAVNSVRRKGPHLLTESRLNEWAEKAAKISDEEYQKKFSQNLFDKYVRKEPLKESYMGAKTTYSVYKFSWKMFPFYFDGVTSEEAQKILSANKVFTYMISGTEKPCLTYVNTEGAIVSENLDSGENLKDLLDNIKNRVKEPVGLTPEMAGFPQFKFVPASR